MMAPAAGRGQGRRATEVPARRTHAATAEAPFAAPPNLIRLSVGIESAQDLMNDLENALVPAAARA